MAKVLLVGIASNFFDDFLDVAQESAPGGTEFIPFDNLTCTFNKASAGMESVWAQEPIEYFVPVPGDPGVRQAIYREFTAAGLKLFPPLAHPSSSVSTTAEIGLGSIISRLVSVGFGVSIGEGCHVNRSAALGHHCTVESFVTVGPSASLLGSTRLARGSFIGAGAILLPGVSIGEFAIVGAGSVVTRDVSAGATVVGNPARAKSGKTPVGSTATADTRPNEI